MAIRHGVLLCRRAALRLPVFMLAYGLLFGRGLWNAAAAAGPIGSASYRGAVRWYIADLKPCFPEHPQYSAASALTDGNYRAVLDGLKANAKVNGVRLPIIPAYADAGGYPALYKTVADYARSIALGLYASPLSVGMGPYHEWSDERYAVWLADYANGFAPDFLSPFNEAGIEADRIKTIVGVLRGKLTSQSPLVGPDRQHVARSIKELSADPSLGSAFDIIASHNADKDHSATAAHWSELVAVAGSKPAWSSENPGTWDDRKAQNLPGIAEAVIGGVQGIVIWMAKPSLVDEAGNPTQKALDIAAHLVVSS